MIIAVDGPSGSGKSSTARGVAGRLGLRYLDTGATYRAVTWSALEHGIDLDDTAAVAQRARELRLEVSTDPAHQFVIADGTDVTAAIREPRISETVSKIATNLDVRKELIRRQRAVIDDAQLTGGIVVEGRDIATVVATDAELKVLLTADQEARMARRGAELAAGSVTAEQLRDQIVRRDADDSTVSEFRVASDGAVTIDSTDLSLEEVIDVISRLAKEADTVPRGRDS
jgi:cytidylate kinase